MMSSQPSASGKSRQALVITESEAGGLKIGGLGLVERWRRALAVYAPVVVESPVAAHGICESTSTLLVADGRAVLDDESTDKIASRECGENEIIGFAGPRQRLAPLIIIGSPAVLDVLESEGFDWRDIPTALGELSDRNNLKVRIEQMDSLYWNYVTDKRTAKEVTWDLLKRLRLRSGGFIAKVVNRHVSIRVTRVLLPLNITPNMMTTFAGLLGLVAVYILTLGGYWWGVVGTGIMQLSSILDGVDGEIARMKYQASTFGKYYDSVWDEVNNALFMVAIGYHQYLYYDFFWFFPIGIFTGVVGLLYASANWHSKYKYGIGLYWWFDKYGAKVLEERKASLKTQWRSLLTRDSYYLWFFLLSIASLLPVLMVAMFCSSAVVLVMMFIHIFVKRAQW